MSEQRPILLPRHIAIIMDGNGRWAESRGLPRTDGHRAGMEAVRGIVRAARELGVGWLTLYAFSSENWNRPKSEVDYLMRLPEEFFEKELPEAIEKNVRILAVGKREADRQRGHTRFGPHRADWSLGFEAIGQREHFSRGQQKLAALLMVLSQAQMHARIEGEWPILLLDDLGSELDRGHCSALLDWVQGSGAQSLLSATRVDTLALSPSHQAQLFHVEQGQVRSDN